MPVSRRTSPTTGALAGAGVAESGVTALVTGERTPERTDGTVSDAGISHGSGGATVVDLDAAGRRPGPDGDHHLDPAAVLQHPGQPQHEA